MWLLLLFILIPLLEIWLFILLGGFIGVYPTLLIILLTAVLGTFLVKTQGINVLKEIQNKLNELGNPTLEKVDTNFIKNNIKDGSTIVVNSEDSCKYIRTIINDQYKLINKSISSINMIDLSYESFLEKRFEDLAYYEPLYIKKPYVN